jgi:transcriptional regulator with XRE-family HTH domain
MNEKLKPEQTALRRRLSENLKKFRATQDISQEGLADLAGLHRTYISQVERMVTNVSLDNISLLAKALGVDAVELLAKFEGDGETLSTESAGAKKAQRKTSKI